MVYDIYMRTQDLEFVKKAFPSLLKEHSFWVSGFLTWCTTWLYMLLQSLFFPPFHYYPFLLYLLRFRCSQSDHSGCSRTRALTLSVPGHVEQTQARKCNNCMWFYSFELYPLDFHIFNIEIPVQRTKSWVVTFPLGRAIGFEAFNCFSEGKFFSPTCFRSWIWVGFQLSLDEVVFLSVSTHSSLDAH